MVELASLARQSGLHRQDIVKRALQDKVKLIMQGAFHNSSNSTYSQGQIKFHHYPTMFSGVNLGLQKEENTIEIAVEDITTGYMIFSAMVYCPESTLKIYQFLNSLISTQSPRTIIQAIVNTIQSGDIKELENRKFVNQFYLELDKIFHFQLGKILLATSTPSQLQDMLAKGWPFFTQANMDNCLTDAQCPWLQSLGEELKNCVFSLKNIYYKYFNQIFSHISRGNIMQSTS